jgi:hypothetical protein
MTLDKKTLKKLKSDLQKGGVKQLQERLRKKGYKRTLAYIYYVLDPEDSRWSETIIDEAIALQQELKEKRLRQAELINK